MLFRSPSNIPVHSTIPVNNSNHSLNTGDLEKANNNGESTSGYCTVISQEIPSPSAEAVVADQSNGYGIPKDTINVDVLRNK